MSVADNRVKGWFSVEKDHCDLIAGSFDGRRLPVARSVYFAIVRLANDERVTSGTRDTTVATRRRIASEAGVNPRVVDEYTGELQRLGLLHIERTKVDGANLPNRWTLTSPTPANGGAASAGGGDPADTTPLFPGPPRSCSQDRHGGGADDTLNKEETSSLKEGKEERTRARSVRFGGKIINDNVVDLAASVVELFNGTAGTSYRPFTDDGKPSENLKRVLGAVIGDQRITAAVAEQMIQQALGKADPFWGSSTPHLGHVFGPRVVEGNLEQALRAAAGGARSGLSAADRMVLASRQRTEEAERQFAPPRDPAFSHIGRVSA